MTALKYINVIIQTVLRTGGNLKYILDVVSLVIQFNLKIRNYTYNKKKPRMTLSRSDINKRYNAKNKSKICENAIQKYNENKEKISARRKELYAIKKAERQRAIAV